MDHVVGSDLLIFYFNFYTTVSHTWVICAPSWIAIQFIYHPSQLTNFFNIANDKSASTSLLYMLKYSHSVTGLKVITVSQSSPIKSVSCKLEWNQCNLIIFNIESGGVLSTSMVVFENNSATVIQLRSPSLPSNQGGLHFIDCLRICPSFQSCPSSFEKFDHGVFHVPMTLSNVHKLPQIWILGMLVVAIQLWRQLDQLFLKLCKGCAFIRWRVSKRPWRAW